MLYAIALDPGNKPKMVKVQTTQPSKGGRICRAPVSKVVVLAVAVLVVAALVVAAPAAVVLAAEAAMVTSMSEGVIAREPISFNHNRV